MTDQHRRFYIAVAISASVLALALLLWPKAEPTGRLTVANVDVPVVMHTHGGRLEVATVTATEAVKLVMIANVNKLLLYRKF